MSTQTDLFGDPLPPKKQPSAGYTKHERRGRPNGYAATPGLGPAGERCKSCAHLCRTGNDGRFLKCGLMRAVWTRGNATDIRAKTPACQLWEANPQPSRAPRVGSGA